MCELEDENESRVGDTSQLTRDDTCNMSGDVETDLHARNESTLSSGPIF